MIRHHPAARSTGLLKEVFAASLGPEAIMIAPGCRRTRVSRDLEQMNLPIAPFRRKFCAEFPYHGSRTTKRSA
jgi:hypothetical protein